MMPLPSAFTFSMKRSKFLENCVPSANAVTPRSTTSWAEAGMMPSPTPSAASLRSLRIDPLRFFERAGR